MEWSEVIALAMVGCALIAAGLGGVAAADEAHAVSSPQVVADGPSETAPPLTTTAPGIADQQSVSDDDPLLAGLDEEFDTTEFRIRVDDNGDAVWRFEFRRMLDSEEERDQFDEFAETFRETETEFYQSFEQQALDLVVAGSAATDREMEATSFTRSAERRDRLGNEFGVVEIQFRWTNFAQVDDDGTVTMGDVFQGQLFISEDQRLVVEAGDGLIFHSVDPEGVTSAATLADSTTVTWEGEREFLDGHPRAVFHPPGGPTDDGDESGLLSPTLAFIGLIVVALIVGVGFVIYQRRSAQTDTGTPTTDSPQSAPNTTAESTTEDDSPAISDEELLTDEDRVIKLLDSHGGRMKQVNIVEETGWSKSKVSMLLSDMEDDGTLTKIRVGRENIVALEGHEPDMVGSPFEDE